MINNKNIPSLKETGLKVIALDQGGIYINVDYDATVQAFKLLGAGNADQLLNLFLCRIFLAIFRPNNTLTVYLVERVQLGTCCKRYMLLCYDHRFASV